MNAVINKSATSDRTRSSYLGIHGDRPASQAIEAIRVALMKFKKIGLSYGFVIVAVSEWMREYIRSDEFDDSIVEGTDIK